MAMEDQPHYKTMQTFDLDSIPDLDTCVLGALELFHHADMPDIQIPYKRPMVVGSGNAEATGRIMFEGRDAVFASESTYEEKLQHIEDIDGVVLVSASGGKHAPTIAQTAQDYGNEVRLITTTDNAPASEYADEVYVFPKQKEPYTYNTSTYMGMMFGHTNEDPAEIYKFIESTIDHMQLPDFSQYDKFYLIVPPAFAGIIRMLQVKFIELFGRQVARDIETSEYVKHATTVVPSDELFISFGWENDLWGTPENRLNIPLPSNADYGAMMAIGYYIIGKIQRAHPPYFKSNIQEYVECASQVFDEDLSVIVE